MYVKIICQFFATLAFKNNKKYLRESLSVEVREIREFDIILKIHFLR